MKSLSIAIAFLCPMILSAAEVTSQSTLQLNSPDGLTKVQELKVNFSVSCKYRSGIFWPENKSCGTSTKVLPVNEKGQVLIPAVEKFGGLHGRKIENYEVALSIYDDKDYLAVLSAYTEKSLKKFNFEGKRLDFYRLEAARINVTSEGQDFFGSELTKKDNGYMLVRVSGLGKASTIDDVLITNSLEGSGLWHRDNNRSYNPNPLKDTKEIVVGKTNFAKFDSTADEKLVVGVYYNEAGSVNANMAGSVEVSLSPDALSKVGTVEIKKVK
ncbi:MAG: hypothetical protein K2Q18_17675 [Bdellovibrionales bacterium]|nr:hypothetical protein [Bdellovibrionales bacterium]